MQETPRAAKVTWKGQYINSTGCVCGAHWIKTEVDGEVIMCVHCGPRNVTFRLVWCNLIADSQNYTHNDVSHTEYKLKIMLKYQDYTNHAVFSVSNPTNDAEVDLGDATTWSAPLKYPHMYSTRKSHDF